MSDEIFSLYKNCFSYYSQNDITVNKIIANPNNHILTYSVNQKIVGVSLINKNVIYLLCVDKNYRNRGIGNKLLDDSEKYIHTEGYNEILIGAGEDYIFPGIPMNDGMHDFFKKRGYFHAWKDCGCFDMSLNLKDFNCFEYNLNDTVNGFKYRYAKESDVDKILLAVNEAKKDFIQYYSNPQLYKNNTQMPVLIAEVNKEIAGAIILNIGTNTPEMGSVGCTVTIPKYRNKGIASTMVMIATRQLKNNKLEKAFLGYTYTSILNIYRKSGYKVCMEYFMAKKLISFI